MTETSVTTRGRAGERPAGSLSAELWQAGGAVVERILAHPFLTELAEGSLPDAVFRTYLAQDVRYIDEFVRVMAVVAGRLPARADTAMLTSRAGEIAAEHELHEHLMAVFALTPAEVADTAPSPTTLGYLGWLRGLAHAEAIHEALAGMLACPWVYWEVGTALLADGSPDPRYQAWIERYGGETAATHVPRMLALADRLGPDLTAAQRAAAAERFATGCRWEWLFWDAAYEGRTWPI